jgi:hypothetical protein
LNALVTATRAAVLTTSLEAEHTAFEAADLPSSVLRLSAAATASKVASTAAASEAERLAASLVENVTKATRLKSIATATKAFATALGDQVAELAAGTGDLEAIVINLEVLARKTQSSASAVGSEVGELKRRLATLPRKGIAVPSVNLTYTLFTDWLTGYCVGLNIHNPEPTATTGWLLQLDLGPDTIYAPWNAEFSALTGKMTLLPLFWNKAIQSGETNVSVGFCVNRAAQNGSIVQIGQSTASFE